MTKEHPIAYKILQEEVDKVFAYKKTTESLIEDYFTPTENGIPTEEDGSKKMGVIPEVDPGKD